jgi:hypothetical protein
MRLPLVEFSSSVSFSELEELGYGAIWFSEGTGREAFTQSSLLLSASSKIVVANGIAKRVLKEFHLGEFFRRLVSDRPPDFSAFRVT